ncbi:MAG: pyridoxal phosphate-dependent aminotransferase [Rhodoferax sp.]|nr:pyridoxal phosphate-dependent aminotransferase [Rhodoferax sp.]
MKLSARARRAQPFYVMEIAKAADELVRHSGPHDPAMIYLNIGEPDFQVPPGVREAAEQALQRGHTRYTPAAGLPELRQCLSDWYGQHFGLQVPASRILVTSGASAALQLACLALVETGDEILMPDPCYPCNRQFVSMADGQAVLLPTRAEQRFQPGAEQVRQAWNARTRGVLLASPSNPTGTSIEPEELRRIHALVRERDGVLIADEIYLGLSHDSRYGQSALALGEDVVSINSFSKYFGMTGWRLGWMVLPEPLVEVAEQMAQHLYICPSALAQQAALACFEPASLALFEARRAEFRARRDAFIPALEQAGLKVPVRPDGAFYVWADASAMCQRLQLPGSWELAFEILRRCRVAVTPGRDFGEADTGRFLRFSTANSLDALLEAARRLQECYWAAPVQRPFASGHR